MPEPPAALRLFVAADLPPAARLACARWRDEAVAGRRALRPVADAGLHVTLSFLGWRAADEVPELAARVAGCVRRVGALALGPARWLPPRRPRVLTLEVLDGDGALRALQADVARAVADRERRAFLPHVTVARVRGGAAGGADDVPAPPRVRFEAESLTLYRSHLGPRGARYEALRRAPLA